MLSESILSTAVETKQAGFEIAPRPQVVGASSRARGEGARCERVRRVLRIVLQLLFRPEASRLTDLVALLGVTRRTVFRDIKLLRDIGLPILFNSVKGHYCLFNAQDIPDVTSAAASIEVALQSPPPVHFPETPCFRPDSWPFNWQESVALLALLRVAPAPEGTEWRSILQCVDAELRRRIHRAFGRKAGTVAAHAALLAFKPHLSVTALRSGMERFWHCRMEPNQD